jgi:hypothetical protein
MLQPADADVWCIFDNMALGAATGDALTVVDLSNAARQG